MISITFQIYNSGVRYKCMFTANFPLNPSCVDIDSIQVMIVYLSNDGVL